MTYGLDFVNESVGYITGEMGKVYKTVDGGVCNDTNVEEAELLPTIVIYPNPAQTNVVTIETDEQILNVSCYNLMGQLIFETQEKILNVKNLLIGTYLLKINTTQRCVSKKLIIQ